MREILFRGKRNEDEKWVFGSYITEPWGSCIQVIENDTPNTFKRTKYSVHKETVGQYTGVEDKNGKKIFEGDVLELDGEDGFFEVEYDDDRAMFVICGDYTTFYFDNLWNEVEVIGNVYDNPELVGGAE